MVSAAMALSGLSGCAFLQDSYDDMVGVNRTLPQGSNPDFSNRHAPVLNDVMDNNPGGEKDDRDIYSPDKVRQRHVPVENNASPTSDNGITYSKEAVNAVPVSSGAVYTPASPSAPAVAVNTVPAAPAPLMASAPSTPAYTAPLASQPLEPVHLHPPKEAANIAPSDTNGDPNVESGQGHPSLASVPPIPVTTPKEQSAAELKELQAEHGTSESGRKQLMGDANATVMTSPSTGQLVPNPETAQASGINPDIVMPGVPVTQTQPMQAAAVTPPPPPAPPANTASKGDQSFNSWLHGVLAGPNNSGAVPAPKTATATSTATMAAAKPAPLPPAPPYPMDEGVTYTPPTVNAPPMQASVAVPPPPAPPAPPPMEPVHLHPPAVMAEAPPPPPAPMPAPMETMHVKAPPPVVADATATQTPPEMQPVHLHPPGSLAPQSLASETPASGSAGASLDSDQVNLVPPASASQAHYLPDSRYAARHVLSDYNDND